MYIYEGDERWRVYGLRVVRDGLRVCGGRGGGSTWVVTSLRDEGVPELDSRRGGENLVGE